MADSLFEDFGPETLVFATEDQLVEVERRIASLTTEARLVLQVLSIFFEPCYQRDLDRCLKETGESVGLVSKNVEKTIATALKRLVEARLIGHRSGGIVCAVPVSEIVTRQAVENGVFPQIAQWIETRRYFKSRAYATRYSRDMIRAASRVAFYRGDLEELEFCLIEMAETYGADFLSEHPLLGVFGTRFDPIRFSALQMKTQRDVLLGLLSAQHTRFFSDAKVREAAEQMFRNDVNASPALPGLLAMHHIGLGRIDLAEKMCERGWEGDEAVRGSLHFLAGRNGEALIEFAKAIATIRKATRRRKVALRGFPGLFHLLALLKSGTSEDLELAATLIGYLESTGRSASSQFAAYLRFPLAHRSGVSPDKVHRGFSCESPICHLSTTVLLLVAHWIDLQPLLQSQKYMEAARACIRETSFDLFRRELAAIVGRSANDDACIALAEDLGARIGTISLVDLFPQETDWERALNALAKITAPQAEEKKSGTPERLAWRLHYKDGHPYNYYLVPVLQKKSKETWSLGRPVALKKLAPGAPGRPDCMREQDEAACAGITAESHYFRRGREYVLDHGAALTALVGHPHVYTDGDVHVELVKGEPELRVVDDKGDMRLQLFPPAKEDCRVALVSDSPTRIRVVEFRKEHQDVVRVLGEGGLRVPKDGMEMVRAALLPLSSIMTVHSDVGGAAAAEAVEPDARTYIQLSPHEAGLKGEIRVRPLGPDGASYYPGTGGETLIAFVKDKRLQATRDLDAEKARAEQVVAALPILDGLGVETNEQWVIADPENVLEFLLQLRGLDDTVVAEWPHGEKFRVHREASFKDFHLTIHKAHEWFVAGGGLRIDEDRVLDMKELLRLVSETKGRFLPIGEGEFVALTQEFRKRIEELRHLADERNTKDVRFHPFAALALRDLAEEAGESKLDKAWNSHIARLESAMTLAPEVPSTLRAELRPYQVEGYQWLMRLAAWGVGACLADDMGLGKTIQAIALLIDRAPEGPALVVAPTSVCPNWFSEIQRFAPTLRPHLFGSGDRVAMLRDLQPFDVLIVSYGLLYTQEKAITGIEWRTAILDEAQAIKNTEARRSKAAMNLQADFRLITTGTPVENHLTELWNLFRFINPGLLGSLESFNRRFAYPIERLQDRHVRTVLKRLIQPFILRRTKNQVLDELPPRTDIVRVVEMEPDEAAFYEGLRRDALERLEQSQSEGGQRHMQILAEIMNLRRACCNTRLVRGEVTLPSAKLNEFRSIVDELLENRHKALVFSQFVDHLTILREELDRRAISYQYLDGSTPARERMARVDAFQRGKGDIFLISLRAGGLGLNLTASDYVIHMDPWWNPAVEDQASDRAHRIGQTRPVTVYRIVTKGTIEERIVALHTQKRTLADSLLEGTDTAARIDADELLQLLKEGM